MPVMLTTYTNVPCQASANLRCGDSFERGIRAAIAESQARQWCEENRDALISSNEFVERHGLLLVKFRQF